MFLPSRNCFGVWLECDSKQLCSLIFFPLVFLHITKCLDIGHNQTLVCRKQACHILLSPCVHICSPQFHICLLPLCFFPSSVVCSITQLLSQLECKHCEDKDLCFKQWCSPHAWNSAKHAGTQFVDGMNEWMHLTPSTPSPMVPASLDRKQGCGRVCLRFLQFFPHYS